MKNTPQVCKLCRYLYRGYADWETGRDGEDYCKRGLWFPTKKQTCTRFESWHGCTCPNCESELVRTLDTEREWIDDGISDCPVEVEMRWFDCLRCSNVWLEQVKG